MADFNHDGWNDVVFANQYNGSYSISSYIYWGSADGFSTSSRTDLPTVGATDCTTGDFDRDGDIDLVFANHYNGGYILDSYVYWNVSGSFNTNSLTALPTRGAFSVVARDLNADDLPELIFSNYYDGTNYSQNSYVYWGTSSGYSSTNRTDLATLGAYARATVDDLNSDGSLDIVMCNHYNNNYNIDSYVYWGPDYSSSTRSVLPTSGCISSAVGDFDADGYKDIVFANHYDGDDSVDSYVYYGSDVGYSSNDRQSLATNRAEDVKVKDIDQDGFDDVFLAIYYDGNYETSSPIYYGSSSGFSTSDQLSLLTYGAYAADIIDLDDNGYDDIIIASHYDGDYSTSGFIYWNSSRGIAQTHRSDASTIGATHVNSADLNGDGYPEVIYSNYYSNSTGYNLNSVLLWGADPWPGDSQRTQLPTSGAQWSCIGDLNRDGFQDIVFANSYNGSSYNIDSYIYWGAASGYSDGYRTNLPTSGAHRCLVADLDSDSDLDLVFVNYYNGNYATESYLYWNQQGVFSTSSRVSIPTNGAVAAAAGDLNDDGYLELVFSNHYNSTYGYNTGLYLYWGDSTGYSSSRSQVLTAHGPTRSPILEDLDNDGYIDIVIGCYYDGDYYTNSYVHWGSSTGYSESNKSSLPGYGIQDFKVADLNHDGYSDVILASYYDGDHYITNYIYWGLASRFNTTNVTYLNGYGFVSMAVGDLNDDGWEDLVFGGHYDGDYATSSYIFYNSNGQFSNSNATSVFTYGVNYVALGDLDADGLPEIMLPMSTMEAPTILNPSSIGIPPAASRTRIVPISKIWGLSIFTRPVRANAHHRLLQLLHLNTAT